MTIERRDFSVAKGTRFAAELVCYGSDGAAIDFTEWTGRMQARSAPGASGVGEPFLDLTTENGGIVINGTIVTFILSPTLTAALTFATARYDLLLTSADGSDVQLLAYGTITLFQAVTINS